jgi:hypothetical protein
MSVWTTYMPVGTSAAFAFVGAFAGGAMWRTAFIGHGGLFLFAAAIGLLLPKVGAGPVRRTLGGQLLELKSAYARPALLLLGLAFFLMISVGLGANLSFPQYFTHVLGMSMAQSSSMVAANTLIMVPGSLLTGLALSRGMRPTSFFAVIAVIGLVVGTLAFVPSLGLSTRYVVMAFWYLCSGASVATLMAVLPLIAEPARRGAAAALLNQAAALATFVNPPIWLGFAAGSDWTPFSVLLAIGWGGGVLALWLATRRRMTAASAVA